MSAGTKNSLSVDLPSTRDSMSRVMEMINLLLRRASLPDEAGFDVKLAVQEAVVNAVEHGNECDTSKTIHVACEIEAGVATIIVRDEGRGFDPKDVPDPTRPENILREHGRGLFLMRNLCDEVRFNPTGNEITIVKKVSG